jgi:dynein intermediate chain 1
VKQLDPAEMNKVYQRQLTSINPQAPRVIVHYDYKSRSFQKSENVDNYIMHFSFDGETIQKESEEYKVQEEIIDERDKKMKETIKMHDLTKGASEAENKKLARRIMRNKFNYSERETQTPPIVIRDRVASTAKPNLVRYSTSINQSWAFDLYMKDKNEKALKEKDTQRGEHKEFTKEKEKQEGGQTLYSASFRRCLKVMERMIVQNEQQNLYRDYKYAFSDKDTDLTKKNQSSIPLWSFTFETTKKKNVTSLCWNPRYPDMFVVGYGLYTFGKKKSVGYICVCSLKNNKTPEMVLQTDGEVMSLDFHPHHPALLAVGLYDGVVMVFDIRNKTKQPIYQSSIKTKKHTDPVWQVKWNVSAKSSADAHNNFYSISSDGRVMNWILMKDKLEPEEVIRLKLVNNPLKSKLSRHTFNFRKQAE